MPAPITKRIDDLVERIYYLLQIDPKKVPLQSEHQLKAAIAQALSEESKS